MTFVSGLLGCLILAGSLSMADSFVVTKEGAGFWVVSIRQEKDQVIYRRQEGGKEDQAPVAALDAVIPAVQRGKTYDADEITKYLDRIKRAREKHAGLYRVLNQLSQEWEALQKPAGEFEAQITGLEAAYESGARTREAVKGMAMKLEMMKYKDSQGKYAGRIDALADRVRKEFVQDRISRMDAAMRAGPLTVDLFVQLKSLAADIAAVGNEQEKGPVERRMAELGRTLFASESRQGLNIFRKQKNMDGYLRNAEILYILRNELANTPEERESVDRQITTLLDEARKALPAWTWDPKGYPLTADEAAMLQRTEAYASRIDLQGDASVDEECLIFPAGVVPVWRPGKTLAVPVRLIFNRSQPVGRKFAAVFLRKGVTGLESRPVLLPGLEIKGGRAEAIVREPGPESFLAEGRDGAFYVYLAYLEDGTTDVWRAISLGCEWPMGM